MNAKKEDTFAKLESKASFQSKSFRNCQQYPQLLKSWRFHIFVAVPMGGAFWGVRLGADL